MGLRTLSTGIGLTAIVLQDAYTTQMPIFLLPGLGTNPVDIGPENMIYEVYATLHVYGRVKILPHMPDIDRTVSECIDVASVVNSLAESILADCSGIQPVIVGYSIGGFIGFEVCRRLERQGLPVRLLIMLDTNAKASIASEPNMRTQLAQRAGSGLATVLATVPFLIAMKYKQLRAARLWLVTLRRIFRRRPMNQMRVSLLAAYWRIAIKRVELGLYSGRVLLVKANKNRPRLSDAALSWESYALNMDVVTVEGDHWSVVQSADTLQSISENLALFRDSLADN
jgi:thioesterase domain-containing protein